MEVVPESVAESLETLELAELERIDFHVFQRDRLALMNIRGNAVDAHDVPNYVVASDLLLPAAPDRDGLARAETYRIGDGLARIATYRRRLPLFTLTEMTELDPDQPLGILQSGLSTDEAGSCPSKQKCRLGIVLPAWCTRSLL